MASNIEKMWDWADRLRDLCATAGMDAMTATWQGVTLHATPDTVRVHTPTGSAEMDVFGLRRYALVDGAEAAAPNRTEKP